MHLVFLVVDVLEMTHLMSPLKDLAPKMAENCYILLHQCLGALCDATGYAPLVESTAMVAVGN